MSKVVERVAKALIDADWRLAPWEEMNADERARILESARAALAAVKDGEDPMSGISCWIDEALNG